MRHGAIIVRGGAVQATGFNVNFLDPYYHKDAPKLSIHAEEAAIKMCSNTQGAIIYIARINRRGEQRMSRPCPKCMEMIKQARIKRIVYTINNVEDL